MDYNPSSPIILGQEWVPARDVDLVFDEASNSFEVGHTFRLETDRQVNEGRFYINDFAYNVYADQGYTISIYEKGQEAASGPIQKVVIPCNGGMTTGGITFETPATNVATALWNPGRIRFAGLSFLATAGFTAFAPFFNVSDYEIPLDGKRILGTTLVTTYSIGRSLVGGSDSEPDPSLAIDFGITTDFYGAVVFPFNLTSIPIWPADGRFTRRDRFGNVSYFTGGSSDGGNAYPLTYDELLRFDSAAFGAGRCYPILSANHLGENPYEVHFYYMALEVYYCEETRVAYGTKVYNANTVPTGAETLYTWGANPIEMRTVGTAATNPILSEGEYTVTVTQANFGDNIEVTRGFGPHPELNSVRELYTLPSFEGVRINIPSPIDDSVLGETLTSEQIVEIPQLSLHTSGGTSLTELHAYGRQGAAQVWGSHTVIQDIDDNALAGVDTSYPWIRYYARRWGDTTIPLTVTYSDDPAATASITPDEFDELEEIVDGWKEVTLELETPAIVGTAAATNFTWSATDETAGNRWEILAAVAPALSGGVGDLFQLAPAASQLYAGTYLAPAGAGEELTWMPQGIGDEFVDTPGADDATDAVILISQQLPEVSGFAITTLCQPLTGIGQECGVDPCCIPTSVYFNQLSWDNQSVLGPVGYSYELQRRDEIDTDWATIMLAAADTGAGLVLPGTSGNIASTPDTAVLDIVGDLDLRVDATLDAWVTGVPSGANDYLLGKYDSSINQRSYVIRLSSTGQLQLLWSTDGTVVQTRTATEMPVPYNGRLAVRATLDVNNGAAGHTVTFYTGPTIMGPWLQLGSQVVTAGVTSIHSGTAALIVGAIDAGAAGLPPGTFHAAQVRSGIDGTIVANPDFTAQPTGTTSFVDSAGRTWTVSGSVAEIVNGTVASFNDFEARVGIESEYQIRIVDDYGFYGDWSTTLTETISAPGVVIGCLDEGHLLIFTSNENQCGDYTLAYSTTWEAGARVEEDFVFPEAGFTQLQPMYDRDYFTAFRPSERGGEQFTRTLLVQAAAISAPTLGDFQSLRDMAWDNVNYVCVRDEDGNRWFANVVVPGGRVMRNRRLYMAPVQIRQVTDVPTPVSPTDCSSLGEECE